MAETVKVTVTLPVEQLAELKSRVRNGEIDSVSGYVTATVADRLKREAWLRKWRARVGEPNPEAAAWANSIIDGYVVGERERRAS